MRTVRISTLIPVLCAALALSPTAVASAADVFRVQFKGGVALAVWQTCPVWEAGAICEETVVIASDSMTSEKYPGGRERDAGPRVVLQRFVYEIIDLGDDGLATRPIRESFGGTAEAHVAIDQRSRSGVATAAAIPMHTTEYDGEESIMYEETLSLQVEWVGRGDLRLIDERDHFNDRGQLSLSFTKGWERAAVATGAIDGVPIAGTLDELSTMLITVRQGELRVFTSQP